MSRGESLKKTTVQFIKRKIYKMDEKNRNIVL